MPRQRRRIHGAVAKQQFGGGGRGACLNEARARNDDRCGQQEIDRGMRNLEETAAGAIGRHRRPPRSLPASASVSWNGGVSAAPRERSGGGMAWGTRNGRGTAQDTEAYSEWLLPRASIHPPPKAEYSCR